MLWVPIGRSQWHVVNVKRVAAGKAPLHTDSSADAAADCMDGAAAATAAAASSDDDDRDGEGEDGLEPSSTSSDDDTARVHNNPEALVVCPELKLQF